MRAHLANRWGHYMTASGFGFLGKLHQMKVVANKELPLAGVPEGGQWGISIT